MGPLRSPHPEGIVMAAITCAWCSAYSNMNLHGSATVVRAESGQGKARHLFNAGFTCSHCKRMTIGEVWGDWGGRTDAANHIGFWTSRESVTTWTPSSVGGREFPDVPEHIASAADEAFRCRSIGAYRASILMARAVVEATAKDQGIHDGNLAAKIEQLSAKGIVRSFTKDAAHELRFLGNGMAHGDFVDPTGRDDCDAVLEVVAEILNEVYQGPARVARMRSKRTGDGDADASIE